MAIQGEESIKAVSSIFSQLADDGGAAADSFAAVDRVLKNNVQRNLLRFNKVITDLNRQLQLQNKSIRDNAKMLKQAASGMTKPKVRPFAEPRPIRTPAQPKEKDKGISAPIDSLTGAIDDISDALNNPFNGAITETTGLFKKFSIAIGAAITVISAFTQLKTVLDTRELKAAQEAKAKAEQDAAESSARLAKQAERDAKVHEELAAMGDEEALRLANAVKMRDDLMKASEDEMEASREAERMMREFQNALLEAKRAIKSGLHLNTFTAVIDGMEEKFKTAALAGEQFALGIENNRKLIEVHAEKALKLRSQAEKVDKKEAQPRPIEEKEARKRAEIKFPDLFDTDKLKEAVVENAKKSGLFETVTSFFKGTLGRLTLVLTGVGAAAIFAANAIKGFAMGAIPKFLEYIYTPMQKLYGFITGPLDNAFSRLTSFVSKLNPAYGEMASRALDDLSAVIGKLLLPLFMSAVEILKVFTSTLARNLAIFTPAIKRAANALAQLGGAAIGAFMTVLQAVVPLLENFITALENNLPTLIQGLVVVVNAINSQLPMLMNALTMLGPLIQQYLVMQMRQFQRDADLAAQAARNNAEAMALNGEAALNFTDVWGQFMYALNTSVMTFGRGVNYTIAGITSAVDEVLNYIPGFLGRERNWWTAEGRKKILEHDEAEQKRMEAAMNPPEPGEGDFGGIQIAGQDIGAPPPDAIQEGFAARGAQFQEIGALGKNLQQAAFGGGTSPEEQQVGLQQMIVNMMQQMMGNQNQFNGAVPAQGVR